jgi:uncharacterized protein YqeY
VELKEAALVSEMQRAMKAREALRVNVLRGLLAAIKNVKVEQRVAELRSEQIAQIVRREVKMRDEVLDIARRGQRSDVVEQNEAERAILERLLPAVLTTEELDAAVRRFHAGGAASIGEIMKKLQAEFPGRVDGKQASEAARRILGGGG